MSILDIAHQLIGELSVANVILQKQIAQRDSEIATLKAEAALRAEGRLASLPTPPDSPPPAAATG